MKKKNLLMTAIAIFGLATITMAQVPSYVPNTGLVGWWPFSGNANDQSGNGLNGIVTGATLTSDRNGTPNNAYNFNYANWSWGSGGDEIFIPFNSLLNTPNLTVSVWAMRNSAGYSNQQHTIINRYQYGYSTPYGEHWQVLTEPSPSCLIKTQIIQSAGVTSVNTGPTLSLINWFHVVMTFDGSSIKQFINGNLYDSIPANGLMLNVNGNSGISIGVSDQANGHWGPFDGKIDDIGIWDRALTECEIQNLYSSQLNSTFVNAGTDQTICNGDPVTLSALNSQNYSWDNGVADGVAFNPTATQDYTVSADSAGCLSTDVVTVTVNEHTSATQTETALDSYTWPINSQTYTQSGTYTAVIPNAAGCDSTITLDLSLDFTGINEFSEDNLFTVFPNPAQSVINIKADNKLIGDVYTIYDNTGRVVLTGKLNSKDTIIELYNLSGGIYMFSVGENMKQTFKVIKE